MAGPISNTLVSEISEALARDEPVRRRLPDGGRLHIDRKLPFLCVYRHPPRCKDHATERLLTGEAAYLLTGARASDYPSLTGLLAAIIDRQMAAFGAFMLLELWEEDLPNADAQPRFRIVAPDHKPPQQVLEELESALHGITINDKPAEVELIYRRSVHPPGLKPLHTGQSGNLTTLGLAISPIYRDAQSGVLYPIRLSRLHHELARSLKRAFYVFARAHTKHRPAHFYALGRRAVTRALKTTDHALAEISQAFDLLLHVTPLNAAQAWEAFQSKRFRRQPEFLYRPRPIDPALMKRALYAIPIEQIEDPTLACIYRQKQDELDRQITLVADRNTPRFLYGSLMLFGKVESELLALAKQILEQIPPHLGDDRESEYLDAEAFAGAARKEIRHYQRQDASLSARVEVREDVTGIFVSQGNFLIGRDAHVPRARVEATLSHEIGTHVLTYHNGHKQPLHEFYTGMAGYEPMQEGLAVLAEYLVGGLSRPRLRLLAGRVVAVHCIQQGADFVETFDTLHAQHAFSRKTAYTVCMRVFRGGGYTKDVVYLRGLAGLLRQLADDVELGTLLLGKISLEFVPMVEELVWREILTPGPLHPRYLDDPAAQQRLQRLRQGASVLDLIPEAT